MGKLDRYVLRRFLGYYGVSLLYLVGLFVVVDVVSRLDSFLDSAAELEKGGRSVYGAMLSFYAAGLPLIMLQVAPFVTVMGACMAIVDLRRWNEFYPMVEAGRSPTRILAPVLGFSVLLTGGLVLLQETVAPRAVEARLRVERVMEGQEERTTSKVPHVRDNAGNTWSFGRYDHHDRKATRVRVVPFRTDGREYDLLEMRIARCPPASSPRTWTSPALRRTFRASRRSGSARCAPAIRVSTS
ncbi:MAG: LptF/LptG family permease [Planctomycetota bacterium]|jgi:lipopolysaccharide export system permease protein